MAGAIISPVATLAGLFAANLRNLAYALQQVADRKARRRGRLTPTRQGSSTHGRLPRISFSRRSTR